jgi:hypothetical protein
MRRLAGRVKNAEKDEPSAVIKNKMLVTAISARVNEPPVFGDARMGRGTCFGSRLRHPVIHASLL